MAVYGFGPPGPIGVLLDPVDLSFVIEPDPEEATNYRPVRGQALVLIARPYDPSIVEAIAGPPFPIGVLPDFDTLTFGDRGGSTLVVAATDGFTSRPDDDPAHTWFAPVMIEGFNFDNRLFRGIEPTSGSRIGGGGAIKFGDPEGRLDAAMQLGWDGRELELRRGAIDAPLSAYQRVARMTTAGWGGVSRAGKSLKLRDQQERLYATPLLGEAWDGSGGEGGSTARLKPFSAGWVWNVEPVLFDPSNLVYAWHVRAVDGIEWLKVGGVSWTDVGDYGDYDSLVAASLTSGQFATCNAKAYVRLGGEPAFPVRLTGRGDAYGGYVDTRAGIVRRLACTRGALPLSDSDDLDLSALSRLAIAQPFSCGWHFPDAINIGNALDVIMAGIAGWWTVDLDGRLAPAQLELPSATADFVIDCADSEVLIGEPTWDEWLVPRLLTRIGYQFNNAPMGAADLAGEVAADTQLYGDAMSLTPATETQGVRAMWPTSREVAVAANFKDYAAALGEQARQRALFSTLRRPWIFPVALDPLSPLLNKTAEVRNLNRLGFGASTMMRVIGTTAGAGAITTNLILWG